MNTEILAQAMNTEIKRLGGIDAAIEACERMYSASFRSEAYKLSEVEDWESLVSALKSSLVVPLYCKEFGIVVPVYTPSEYDWDDSGEDSYGYEMDAIDDQAAGWFAKEYPDFDIDGSTLIVDLCNYKGEGAGEGLYCINSHLNIFKSKSHSFSQVN